MVKHYGRAQNDMIRPRDGGTFVVKQKQDKQELQDMTSVAERHRYNDQSYWTGRTQKKNDRMEPKDRGKSTVRQKQGQLELQDAAGIVERHRYKTPEVLDREKVEKE